MQGLKLLPLILTNWITTTVMRLEIDASIKLIKLKDHKRFNARITYCFIRCVGSYFFFMCGVIWKYVATFWRTSCVTWRHFRPIIVIIHLVIHVKTHITDFLCHTISLFTTNLTLIGFMTTRFYHILFYPNKISTQK